MVPTYSPSFLRYFQKYDFVFTDSDSDSGGLARAYIQYAQKAKRGRHPTNSCTSCGFHAETIAASDGLNFQNITPMPKLLSWVAKI